MTTKRTDDTLPLHRRFSEVKYEANDYLLPIDGYQKVALLPLEDTMQPIQQFIDPDIQDKVYVAKKRCQKAKDGLTLDESASIQVYTMESTDAQQSLYYNLNKTLRKEDRRQLIPYFPYLKLLLTALWKLPSFRGRVWRGVNGDLSKNFKEGEGVVWWGFSSCTRQLNVLESDQFLGKENTRTLFTIECSNGKLIKDHSYFVQEDEVLLLPGVELRVLGKVRPATGLTIVELREVTDGPIVLLKPPFVPTSAQQRVETNDSLTDCDRNVLLTAASTSSAAATVTPNDTSRRVYELVQKLRSNDTFWDIGYVSVDIANLSLDDCVVIAAALNSNENVRTLSIRPGSISPECLQFLIEAIKTNSYIESLDIHGDDDDVYLLPLPTHALINTLNWNRSIERLWISSTMATDDDVRMITELMTRKTTMTELYLYRNPYLTIRSAVYVSELLMTTSTVTAVGFGGESNVNDLCAMLILAAVDGNSSLKELRMPRSQISDEGAKAFGEMLSRNRTLTSLFLQFNQISDVGAQNLANGLKYNSVLRELFITDNHFTATSTGGRALMAAKNSNLKIHF